MRPHLLTIGSVFVLVFLMGTALAGEASSQRAVMLANVGDIQDPKGSVFEAEIQRFHRFTPALIKVTPGTTVVWVNRDVAEHNVRVLRGDANELSADVISELFFPDETTAITFHQEGTYRYFCEPHPYMQGKVIVERGE